MQICTLLTRIQCKVSDTQVTVKACGPLVLSPFTSLLNYTACANQWETKVLKLLTPSLVPFFCYNRLKNIFFILGLGCDTSTTKVDC